MGKQGPLRGTEAGSRRGYLGNKNKIIYITVPQVGMLVLWGFVLFYCCFLRLFCFVGQAVANRLPEYSLFKHVGNPCLCWSWGRKFGYEQFFLKNQNSSSKWAPLPGAARSWACFPVPGCESEGVWKREGCLKVRLLGIQTSKPDLQPRPQGSSHSAHNNPQCSSL